MEYRQLGQTGLTVSRLCFGALTIGPLQARLPLPEGVAVIEAALDAGVNFIDTASLYGTYEYIRQAIKGREGIIVASKSYDWTYEGMKESVKKACRHLGREYVDIFMLHEQTSRLTLQGHGEALAYLSDAKKTGLIRSAGVSTHTVEVVRAAAMIDDIDVIHPIFNMAGVGILDGTVEDMSQAIEFAAGQGKGIYSMKALGGGHLCRNSRQALDWILNQDHIASVAVGMQTVDEVLYNASSFAGLRIDDGLEKKVQSRSRKLLIEEWCQGCGTCVTKCPTGALTILGSHAIADNSKCILCGYCGAHCPEFALKII